MGFIVGYFFSKAYLQRSHVQYDRWYVYDTCLGKCLFCDNQDQENNEDIMDDQEAMVSSEDELKSDTIKNSEEVLVEIDSAENRVEEEKIFFTENLLDFLIKKQLSVILKSLSRGDTKFTLKNTVTKKNLVVRGKHGIK